MVHIWHVVYTATRTILGWLYEHHHAIRAWLYEHHQLLAKQHRPHREAQHQLLEWQRWTVSRVRAVTRAAVIVLDGGHTTWRLNV